MKSFLIIGMGSRRLTSYSSSCAYYLFMSLVPVIMLLVSVLQYTCLLYTSRCV